MSEDRGSRDDRTRYGGQAVVEGVMMRSPNYFAIACRRRSTNEIVTHLEPVPKGITALGWLNRPFLRGTFALIDTMALGIRSLTYAANIQIEDEYAAQEAPAAGAVGLAMGEGAPLPKNGMSAKNGANAKSSINAKNGAKPAAPSQTVTGIAIGATTVIALIIGFLLFWTFPGFLTDQMLAHFGYHRPAGAGGVHPAAHHYATQIGGSLIEGIIRLVIFFAYLLGISRMAHVQRVFEYHGAEHKAINTLEAGLPLTVQNAQGVTRIHPRCGTNFIFIVLTTSIVVFSVIPRYTLGDGIGLMLSSVGYRILLMPVVAGIAYELLKFAGAHRDKKWALALVAPGLWTQYITTREPDDSQIEVAIASLQCVWDKEHEVDPPSATGTDPAAAAVA